MEKRQIATAVLAILMASTVATGHAEANGEVKASGEEEKNTIKLSYKLGKGLTIEDLSGDYRLDISGRIQGRFTYNALETAADNNTLAVQRGKIKLGGHVFNKNLKYGFQMDLSTITGGAAVLDDYYIDWTPYDYFGIQVGQFKVPFLMQFLTSSANQQFVDRALSTGFFNHGRDIGINFHGDIVKDRFKYALFAVNGDRANTINTNQGFMAGTRVEGSFLGKYEYSESDVNDSQEVNFGAGLSYLFHDSLNSTGAMTQSGTIPVGTKASMGTVDAGLKYKGLSIQTAAMITRTHEGADLTNWGYNAQVGYFVVPKHLELAVKQNTTVFSNATANQHEYSGGVNYFIKGHPLKLTADYALVMNNRGLNLNDHRFRTQLQVTF